MNQLLELALEKSRNGEPVALATIVRAQGSTPRATGTKMLVFQDGSFKGTIGGGEMERRVIDEARLALESGSPRLVNYTFREVASGDPGICGGENDVFIDVIAPPRELLVIGAGHVGQAVAQLAANLSLECVVFDNRPEWANVERFPTARQVLVGELEQLLNEYPISCRSYIVITTRGHEQDAVALACVVRSPAAYIGMIGSRRKTLRVYEQMREQGIEQALLDRVHAPIGLDIGAQTPEEIAVSIIGQIIAVMHGAER